MIGADLMAPVKLLSSSAGALGSMTIIRNAKFRILPPQPCRRSQLECAEMKVE